MQDRPLALPHVFHRAEQLFGHKPIVTATAKGEVATTVAEWAVRVRRLATALDTLGVPADGRVGDVLLEHRVAPGALPGGPLHRPGAAHAQHPAVPRAARSTSRTTPRTTSSSSTARCCRSLTPLRRQLHTVRHVVVIDDGAGPCPLPDGAIDYDELLASAEPFEGRFEVDDENSAAAMCYTLRHHRQPEGRGLQPPVDAAALADLADGGRAGPAERDVVMPVVPMFHANAWGLPYAGAAGRVEHGVPPWTGTTAAACTSGSPRPAGERSTGTPASRGGRRPPCSAPSPADQRRLADLLRELVLVAEG